MGTVDQELADLVRELPPKAQAEVRNFIVFLLAKHRRDAQASAMDILEATRGGAFRNADEVSDYLRQERDSWQR